VPNGRKGGGAPHEGGGRKPSWSLVCGAARRMIAADVDTREAAGGGRLAALATSRFPTRFTFGDRDRDEQEDELVGRQRGSALVSGEEWRPAMETGDWADGPFVADGGRCNGTKESKGRAGLEAGGVLSPLLEIAEMFNLIINEKCTKYMD
jgi:hypothetical protein